MSVNRPEPRDIINRNKALEMTNTQLKKEINRLVSKLNKRITSLEKSGLSEESRAYYWITDFSRKTFGQPRLKSSTKNLGKKQMAKYYSQLKHLETYHLLKSQIETDRERLRNQINLSGKYNFTDEDMRAIGRAMNMATRLGSEPLNARLRDLMGSNEIREMFLEKRMSPDDITENFVEDLKEELKKLPVDNQRDAEMSKSRLKLFLDNYDPSIRRPIVRMPDSDTYFDPTTDEIIDPYTGETIGML